MGIIDYSRLPKRACYWYRNAYRGIAPPIWSKPGTPVALRVTSSSPVIRHADGTDDLQLVVTVIDADGVPLSNSPPVHLSLEAGPGELPTGRHIDFTPDGDIPVSDGQAAIAMRSWQAGVTRIRATSPGLRDGVSTVTTTDGPPFVAGVTPLAPDRPYIACYPLGTAADQAFGLNNPTDASSSAAGHPASLANDGNPDTWWTPAASDAHPWILIDPERTLTYRQLSIRFAEGGRCDANAEAQTADGTWQSLASALGTADRLDLPTRAVTGKNLRLNLTPPPGESCAVAEVGITGSPDAK